MVLGGAWAIQTVVTNKDQGIACIHAKLARTIRSIRRSRWLRIRACKRGLRNTRR